MADYNAGSVSTRLRGDFDPTDFHQLEAAVARVNKLKGEAKLSGDFDKRAFEQAELELKRFEQREVTARLKLETGRFKERLAESERLMDRYERNRAKAAADEVRSSAAILREHRKKHTALLAEIQDHKRNEAALRSEGRQLASEARLHGASTRATTQHSGSMRTLTRETAAYGRTARSAGRDTDQLRRHVVRADTALRGFIPDLNYATRIPIAQILAFGAAFAGVIPPVVALTGALGPLVGILGALPTLVTAGIGALSAAVLGLSGVSKAVTESWQSQTQTAGEADKANKQVRDSTEATAEAQQALADSIVDATRRLEDMRLAEQRLRQEREAANDSLADARQELARLIAAGADAEEISDQRREVASAELDVKDARLQSARATEDLRAAEAGGVRKMDEVVAAQRALRDATEQAADQTAAMSSNAKQLENAYNNLSPAGKRFVDLIKKDFFPLFKQLRDSAQEGLLPGLGKGLVEARKNFPVVNKMIGDYAETMGDAAEAQGKFFGEKESGRDFATLFGRGNKLIEQTAKALVDVQRALLDIGVASKPLTDFLGAEIRRLARDFRDWAQAGRESGNLNDFFERSVDTIKQVSGTLWDTGRALTNIGEIGARVWGRDMLGGIRDVARDFRRWTESVKGERAIEGYFERWRNRWQKIADEVKRVVDRYRDLRREGQKPFGALTTALAEAFSRAVPKIISNIGRQLPTLAKAFVQGFLAADAWGRFLVGAWLIRKIGGPAAILTVGRTVAGLFLGGFLGRIGPKGLLGRIEGRGGAQRFGAPAGVTPVWVVNQAAGVPGGVPTGGRGAPLPRGGLAALTAGVGAVPVFGTAALAGLTVGTIATGMILTRKDVRTIETRTGGGGEGHPRSEHPASQGIVPGFVGDPRAEGERLKDSERNLRHHQRVVDEVTKKNSDAYERGGQLQTRVWSKAQRDLTDLRQHTARQTQKIRERFSEDSNKGREALAKNYREAADAAKRQMDRTGRVTKAGLAFVKELFIKEQLLYGATRGEATASFKQEQSDQSSHKPYSAGGGAPGAQRGATIVPGRGSGDKVPVHVGGRLTALVEPGELISVLNRKATDAMMRINRRIPRFAGGGMVRVPGDPDDTGGRDRVSPAIAGSVAQWVRKYRANVGYAYDPGHHQSAGHNVTGTATDVYPGPGGDWDLLEKGLRVLVARGLTVLYGTNGVGTPYPDHGRGNHAHIEWGSGGGAFPLRAPKIGRISLRGLGGPHGALVEKGLNRVRMRANRRLRRLYQNMVDSGMPGGPADYTGSTNSARNRQIGITMAKARGWGGAEFRALDHLWGVDEGHWDENLANLEGSGAYGIAQALPASKYPSAGQPSAPPGAAKAAAQIGWGLNYIRDRYGDPIAAHRFRHSMGWYSGGGVLRLQGGGHLEVGAGGHLEAPGWSGAGGAGAGGPSFPTQAGRSKAWAVIETLKNDITKLGNRYTLDQRRQDLREEDLINEGDEHTAPSLNMDAINTRLTELDRLIELRRQITIKYKRLLRYMRGLITSYRDIQRQMHIKLGRAAKHLGALKGRGGKEAKKSRDRIAKNVASWKGTLQNAQDQLNTLKPEYQQTAYDWESSQIDLAGLRIERGEVAGTELPADTRDTSADQEARTAAAERRAEIAETSAKSLRTALQTFAGPGDLGRGGFTALGAVLNPTGVVGPGYAVGPSGQLVPVVSAGAAAAAALGGGGGVQAAGGNTYVFPSTVPYTREQAASVAGMAVSGIESQAPRTSARIEVSL